jgi:hypothetical protein
MAGDYEYFAAQGHHPLAFALAELVDNALRATKGNTCARAQTAAESARLRHGCKRMHNTPARDLRLHAQRHSQCSEYRRRQPMASPFSTAFT